MLGGPSPQSPVGSPQVKSGLLREAMLCYTTVVSDFRKLVVWNAAQDLAVMCYRATEGFPTNEEFGLKSQIRRAAVSVPAKCGGGVWSIQRS